MSVVNQHISGEKLAGVADNYCELFEKGSVEDRQKNYTSLVNAYYDLATDFYEYGWGQSFHFAPRYRGESRMASIARHEHYLAHKLELKPGDKVLDVGCGVGGPLVEIARFSGAHVTGLNNNAYQISRGNINLAKTGLSKTCGFIKSDFMKVDLPDGSFDKIYAIEATCHAPSKVGIYSEIYRLLKPGGMFGVYEWLMTENYNPKSAEHNKIKEDIEIGDGLPNLDTPDVALKALKDAGFEILEDEDLAPVTAQNPVPWYAPMVPNLSLEGIRISPIGRMTTHYLVTALEAVGLAPKGTVRTHSFLLAAADGLRKGGEKEIFTPMYFYLCRKPLDGETKATEGETEGETEQKKKGKSRKH